MFDRKKSTEILKLLVILLGKSSHKFLNSKKG